MVPLTLQASTIIHRLTEGTLRGLNGHFDYFFSGKWRAVYNDRDVVVLGTADDYQGSEYSLWRIGWYWLTNGVCKAATAPFMYMASPDFDGYLSTRDRGLLSPTAAPVRS